MTSVRSVVVPEVQADGTRDGWLASLSAEGALQWRRAFATDFQMQVKGTRVEAMMVLPSTSTQRCSAVGDRTRNGETFPEVLQFDLNGNLDNSGTLGTTGVARGGVAEVGRLVSCSEEAGTLHVKESDFSLVPSRDITVSIPGAALALSGCRVEGDALWVAGNVLRAEGSAPLLAKLSAATLQVLWVKELKSAQGTTLFSLSAAGGTVLVGGREERRLRRWVAAPADFTAP